MFDINTIINTAIQHAVTEAMYPVILRIEQLERHRDELRDRLAQAQSPAPAVNPEQVADAMDQQEWFWNKINAYVDRHMEARQLSEDYLRTKVVEPAVRTALSVALDQIDDIVDFEDIVSDALNNIDLADRIDLDDALDNIDFNERIDIDDLVRTLKSDFDIDDLIRQAISRGSFDITFNA